MVAKTGAHPDGQAQEQGAQAEPHEDTGRDGGSEEPGQPGGNKRNDHQRGLEHRGNCTARPRAHGPCAARLP